MRCLARLPNREDPLDFQHISTETVPYSAYTFKARVYSPLGCFQLSPHPLSHPHHHPLPFNMVPPVLLAHKALSTTFEGVNHPLSTSKLPIQQFRGIKYASIPARFRQSKLFTSYSAHTKATNHG